MLKTFIKDRLVRNKEGIPVGRCIILDDSMYEEGKALSIVLLKIPMSYYTGFNYIYIDGYAYNLPKDIPSIRKSRNGPNIILNTVVLEPGNE